MDNSLMSDFKTTIIKIPGSNKCRHKMRKLCSCIQYSAGNTAAISFVIASSIKSMAIDLFLKY